MIRPRHHKGFLFSTIWIIVSVTIQKSKAVEPSMPMPMIAPLFIENGELSTSVTIVSAMARATTVDVVLLNQDGGEIARRTYPLDGHAQQVVRVSDLLQTGSSSASVGSVRIETDAEAEMNMAVVGQVSIAGKIAGAPVYLEEEFPMTTKQDSGVLRAVAPAGLGFPVLALRSTSSSAQTATINCLYEKGNEAQSIVQLAPGEMALTAACVPSLTKMSSIDAGLNQPPLDTKGATGITVTSSAERGMLGAYGFMMGGDKGSPTYTALNFADAGAMNSGKTVFAGVPVGRAIPLGAETFVPKLALTNFASTPAIVNVIYAVTGGDGPSERTVATVTVGGRSSLSVPLANLDSDSQMRNSFVVQSTSVQGSIYASMIASGAVTYRSVQLIGRDWWQPYNGGSHPWTTVGVSKSTLLLFNYSGETQKFFVSIEAAGILWQQSYNLVAKETKALDIGDLIATKAKDEKGQVFPSATTGVVNWFTPNFGQGTGRLLLVQPDIGLARNYSCQTGTSLCGSSSMLNNTLTLAAGTSGSMGPYQVDLCTVPLGQCGGSYLQTAGWGANWSSANSSVASTSGMNVAAATINGISGGSAQITATGTPLIQIGPNGSWTCYAVAQTGNAVVLPTITWNGSKISGTTQSAVVGEQISLTGSPGNGTWRIFGINVGGFNTGSTNAGSTSVNTSGTGVLFYWVTGGTQTATYTVNGQVAGATFTVAAPSGGTITAQGAPVTITNNSLRLGSYPNPPPGISFSSPVTSPAGYSGGPKWVQIINSSKVTLSPPTGSSTVCTLAGLDNSYPYPGPGGAAANDSPGVGLSSSAYSTESDQGNFTMYLMWQSSLSNSIAVPLSYVTWSWSGVARNSGGTWTASGGNPTIAASMSTTTYPSWDSTTTNGPCGGQGATY